MNCFTAQRVKSHAGEVGINRYRYSFPDALAGRPSLWSALDGRPGSLDAFEYAVKPGNNAVISYLDVVAPSASNLDQISQALESLDARVAMSTLPIHGTVGSIAFRFGAILALEGEPARREFHELARAALKLVHQSTPAPAPLVVIASTEPDGVVYRLDESSRQRLGARATSVKMTSESAGVFDVLPEIALLLTRFTLDELAAAGGARIVELPAQREVARWPTQSPAAQS